MNWSKEEARELLRASGLDSSISQIYQSPTTLTNELLRVAFPTTLRFVAREAAAGPSLNLSRLVNCSAEELVEWAGSVRAPSSIIVTPYEPLMFCGQIAWYSDGVLVEVVPGVWEMQSHFRPFRLLGRTRSGGHVAWERSSSTTELQKVRWLADPVCQVARVEDWMVASTRRWVEAHAFTFRSLADSVPRGLGIKFHFTVPGGFSAQNLYANVPDQLALPVDRLPDGVAIIRDLEDPIPRDATGVQLELELTRAEADKLDQVAVMLRGAHVEDVYIRSGLLSHSAIRLREHGFNVHSC